MITIAEPNNHYSADGCPSGMRTFMPGTVEPDFAIGEQLDLQNHAACQVRDSWQAAGARKLPVRCIGNSLSHFGAGSPCGIGFALAFFVAGPNSISLNNCLLSDYIGHVPFSPMEQAVATKARATRTWPQVSSRNSCPEAEQSHAWLCGQVGSLQCLLFCSWGSQ